MFFTMRRHILSLMIIWTGSCATAYSSILQEAIEVPSINALSGINFADSGPNPGRRRDSDEGYYLRIVSAMQNQSLSSGDKAQFKCKVDGYPTDNLKFTWYKSNKVIDLSSDPRYSIRQKDGTSRFQIQDLFTSDSARYRCEASNGHRRVATEAYLKVSFVLPPAPGPDEEPMIPQAKCEKYTGYACRPYLANKYVYIDPYQQQAQVENSIALAVNRLKDPGIVSDACLKYAIPALCYYVFPICDDEDDVLSTLNERSPEERATRLCREDCELLMHDVCKTEFANPDDDMFMEEISSTANCSQLPRTMSRGSSCLKVGLPSVVKQQHSCYNNTGTEYKGTQRKTESGIRCKSWPTDIVKEHTELAGGHNFCRNPGNVEDRPWCYIDDARRTRELCDVPKCAVSSTGSGLYAILIPSVTVPLFILFTVGICLFCLARRRKERTSKGIQGKPVTNGSSFHSVEMTMAPKQISNGIPHVSPQSLHFTMDLGDGQFGKIYKAQLSQNLNFNTNFPVAVKTLTEGAMSCQVDEFQREMEKLSEIQHPNVACLKAVVIHPGRRCMIFEYTNRVDLHEFLSLHSPHSDVVISTKATSSASSQTSTSLEPHDFINMMTQISFGLDYLTSHNYFHRDLAARNILVCQNNLLKICNLDVVRDCHLSSYYRSPQGGRMLPIRWMAPECIAHNTYSGKTTVWSFGVLIWEIYSYGMQPYCGYSNQEVLDMITRFQLLTCPDQCPARVYSLMRECWAQDPVMRPNLKEIYAKLCGWDSSNATRMTSQLARGIHRQVTNIMREGQYGQYSGMDSASLPSYNTPSPPPTYNAVTGLVGYPNIAQQQQFNTSQHMNPTAQSGFGQSSVPNTSAQMYPNQRLVVDLQDPCQAPQNYQGNYETTSFQPRYYTDHQNSQVYMGANNIRRPPTQSSRSTSSCASSCSEYGAASRSSSAGHPYGHQQGSQYQKFYGGIDYHDQHFQQQNVPTIQTYRRPLSGVIEDECGSSITQKSHVVPSSSSVDLPPFPNSTTYSDVEATTESRDEKMSVTEQCMTHGQQAKQTPEIQIPKAQNEETESSTSSTSAKAPSCDSGLPVDEDADTTNLTNQSTSITSPLLGPKPYIPKTPMSRSIPFKNMSERNFVG